MTDNHSTEHGVFLLFSALLKYIIQFYIMFLFKCLLPEDPTAYSQIQKMEVCSSSLNMPSKWRSFAMSSSSTSSKAH